MHLQRNATQRNAYQNYILNNNFKFYIFQFFRAVNFLSAVFGFAKISSFIKESKNSCSFFVEKKNQKTTTFFVKKSGQKNNYSRITKSIRKNFFALCGKFINLFDAFNFEIISRNENYAFDYNKYFCRNGNNQSLSFAEGVLWERGFAKNRSNLFSGLLHFIRNDGDDLFSRNDYGGKFIFGFWDNLNFGFLFNRKTKKINLCQRFSVGEGEQK